MMAELELKALAKEKLDPKRYAHVLRVVSTSAELAERFGADEEAAKTAAYLHDIAKNLSDEELEHILQEAGEADYLLHSPSVWHAPAGAFLAKTLYNTADPEILAAIKYHTTGRPAMGLTEAIVFLADYIEPGRKQPGVEQIREMAKTSLERAVAKTLANTVAYLRSTAAGDIHPDTLEANEHYQRFLET